MWIARFKLSHKGDIFTTKTRKHRVEFFASPLARYAKGNGTLFVVAGFITGESKGVERFIAALRADRRVRSLDRRQNFITLLIHYSPAQIARADMDIYYDPANILLEPVHNASDGWEYWMVGSFEKPALTRLVSSAQKLHGGKLLSMTRRKIGQISLRTVAPKISRMQRKTVMTAFEEGYYAYPRRISIEDLAVLLGISYATCQEHLRKAEIALLPSVLRSL